MKVIGLTGGIGSGKTTVAKMFKDLGVPVYIADDEAKRLMNHDQQVKEQVLGLFGTEAYTDSTLNRAFIASKVFSDKDILDQLNAIVHPAVAQDFQKWKKGQTTPYVIYEAAILFEQGGYKKCDYNVLVTAPVDLRIERIRLRDNSTLQEIHSRMSHQWNDEKKALLADFVIENIDISKTHQEVRQIHQIFLKSA